MTPITIYYLWECRSRIRQAFRRKLARLNIIDPPVKCPNCLGDKEAGHRYPYSKITHSQSPRPLNYLEQLKIDKAI